VAKKRDANLKEFGISEYAYREMLYFCMQYGEKKNELKDIYAISGIRYDREKIKGMSEDLVFKKAAAASALKKDIEIIEKAAKEADEVLYEKIIDNVCYQTAFEYLNVPCGRRQFFLKRKLFFVKLHEYLNERKRDTQVT